MEIQSGFQLLVFFLCSTFDGGQQTSSSDISIFHICKHSYNMLLCQVANVYESGDCGRAQNMNPWPFCQSRSLLKSWDWISGTEDREKRNKIPKLSSRVFQDLEDENLRIQQHRWKKWSEDRNQTKRNWLLLRTQLKGKTVQRTIDNNHQWYNYIHGGSKTGLEQSHFLEMSQPTSCPQTTHYSTGLYLLYIYMMYKTYYVISHVKAQYIQLCTVYNTW